MTTEMSARAAQGGDDVAPEHSGENRRSGESRGDHRALHRQARDEQRMVLSAAAVCGVQFRVNTIAAALERDAAGWRHLRRARARAAMACGPHAEESSEAAEPSYSFRHALFRQVQYERTAASIRASFTGKWRRARTGARRRRAGRRRPSSRCISSELASAMAAVRYYAEAADAALAHFSPDECMRIIERVPLLGQAPRHRNATRWKSHRNASRSRRYPGAGAGGEARASLQRAYSLLDEAPQHPMCGAPATRIRVDALPARGISEALAVADRAEALGSSHQRSSAPSTACTVHGEFDQLQGRSRPPGHGWSAGCAAERLDVGPGECCGSAGRAARFACQSLCFISVRSSRRARAAARPCPRSRSGMAHGAACRDLVRRAVRGAARQRRARGRSCGRNASARRGIRARSRPNGLSVVSRLGGRPNGTAARWATADPRGIRRKCPARDAGGRKRGAWICGGSARAGRRLGRAPNATRGSAAIRGHARRARVSAAALPYAGRDRSGAWRPRAAEPRFDARSPRPGRRRRRGSS